MNYSMIFNIIGKVIAVEAAFLLPALGIAIGCGERSSVIGFAVAIAAMLVIGLPFAVKQPKKTDIFASEGLITVGLAWMMVSILGALPFYVSGAIPNYIDCLFETVSGFTTTGASILSDVESLPRSILYWRSFTHWLGGMGVLVFLLILNPLSKKNSGENMHLLRAESPGIKISKLVPRMKRSAGILYMIYIALTVLEFFFLWLGKMPLFDAVTLTLGTAGTGGFGVLNDSVASYSPYCQWVITAFMILFSVNFNVYFLLLLREVKKALKNEELWLFFGVVLTATLVISINISGMYSECGETVRHAAFQVASIISTAGFSTADFDLWPPLSRIILLLLMFSGACAGSTGGGLKVVRILLAAKTAKRAVRKAAHPNSVRLIHMDGEVVRDDTVHSIAVYILVYCMIMIVMLFVITLDGLDFETNFTAVVSCLNNIGPGFRMVGPTMNYSCYSWLSKLALSLTMLIGRLEIYPILILFVPSLWAKARR